MAQSRRCGADVQTRVCLTPSSFPPTPLLAIREISGLFCHPVIMWPTHWGWKGLHHQLPTTNPPSSLWLGGHSIFLLSKSPRQSRPWHVMLGEPGHVFPCLSGFPGAEPSPGPLPSPAGIWQHNQSHSVLFCYSSSWRPSFRSSSPTLFIQDFSGFMRTGLSAREETARV